MNSTSINKTAIITTFGLDEYFRTPFGLKNAVQAFKRLIDSILRETPNVFLYLDDILVASESMDEHWKTLNVVLLRFETAGMILFPEKIHNQSISTNSGTVLFPNYYRSFTRWPEVILIPDASKTKVNNFFSGWISRYGVPETIVSDRGTQFTSSLWMGVCKTLGIASKNTTSYHPESNGLIERFHISFMTGLVARMLKEKEDWINALPVVLWGLRRSLPIYPESLPPTFLGPFKVIERHDRYNKLDFVSRTGNVSMDRLLPAFGVTNILPAAPTIIYTRSKTG
ncbi:uncharacterized protein [Lepeophtheirus salmonis]|uniref:uncharacterized protein n=1 Tax=Lepeophtheirus salmonis TaxID=72036 RepID=UPI003AF39852